MALFAIVVLFTACKDDQPEEKQNFIQAKIGSETVTIYQEASLNNDTVPNTFLFSFGKSITTKDAKNDTCLFIQACLNRQNLRISFPTTQKPASFNIYRSLDLSKNCSALYAVVPKYAQDNDLETFHTQDVLNVNNQDKTLLGQITISRINRDTREIEGTFNFTAYGYKYINETIYSTDKYINISNGKFYYHWDDNLDI